jgi:ubiquinone biosynthesis protein Coq4
MNLVKTLRMFHGFWSLSQDPNKLERVFAIADAGENRKILEEIAAGVGRHPRGARALKECPRVGEIDLAKLSKLPEGTLGRVFADHMIANNLDPKAIPVPEIEPGDVRYVKAHIRETHDIWHVVTGFDTDVAGEIGLQAFYLAQFPAHLSAVLIAMAFVHLATKNLGASDAMMNEIMRGWTIGKRADQFFGFEWAKHWTTPLEEVRRMLNVDPNPLQASLTPKQSYVFRDAA